MESSEDRVSRVVEGSGSTAGLQPAELAAAIFDAALDGILVIDEQGGIQAVNRAALQGFGFLEGELSGRDLSVLLPDAQAWAGVGHLETHRDGGVRALVGGGREVTGRRKNGSSFPLHLSVGELCQAGRHLFVCICHDISERRRLTERMAFLAAHDSLTGCLNRSQLLQALELAMQACRAGGRQLAALFIDLDGFKQINDNHGHRIGDRLLQQVAERFQGILRETDRLGRIGGDEFVAAIMLDCEPGVAELLGWRMIEGLQAPFVIEGASLTLRASIGISLFPEHGASPEELVDAADMAMHRAKLDGGSCIRLFSQQLRERSEQFYRMLGRLGQALACERFELRYQLQFDLHSMQPSGLEALLCWRDGEHGLVPSGQFVPLALKHGLLAAIEQWAVRQACRDNRGLIDQGLLDVPVAVNVRSPWFGEVTFVERLRQMLDDTGLPASRLELEISEELAMDDWVRALNQAHELRGLGIGLTLAGFGSGHSSLGRLRHLPVGKLKIDRSFVRGLPGSAGDKAVVHAILGIARSLHMQLGAAGIESTEQLAYLKAEGYGQGQGDRLAGPMALAELVDWLRLKPGRAGH